MDSLSDILAKRRMNEPPEIRIIKDYVRQHFKEDAGVAVREHDIIITVRSSALAGTLRSRSYDISKQLGNSNKRLVFRIGTPGAGSGSDKGR